jgi:N-acetyl-gamma-glutamyl-phosphate reductase
VPVTFTAHLLPIKRGILATVYARLKKGRRAEELKESLTHFYAQSPFVHILKSPDEVNLKSVVGTNRCAVAVACDAEGDPGRVVLTSAIDNLMKGAASQAVQNMNISKGWQETLGLASLRGFFP